MSTFDPAAGRDPVYRPPDDPLANAVDAAQTAATDHVAPPVFRIRDLVVEYDRKRVLRGVSLDIAAGEIVAIMGANGSGKSTLLRAVLGILPVRGGTIDIDGTPRARFTGWSRLGYVPQRLLAGGGVPATVREVVASGQVSPHRRFRLSGSADRAAVAEALAAVGLTHLARESVHELSGGQQQRVLIARALAARPDTFLLDEPMAGVDAENQAALARTLSGLAEAGHTVVLVLHELGPLAPLVGRAVVLSDGVVVHDGAPPQPSGDCARPGHDHVHPHADLDPPAPVLPTFTGTSGTGLSASGLSGGTGLSGA